MKIRTGFVSNSSGSSFILGIAKVSDIEKFNEYLIKTGNKIDGMDLSLMSVRTIRNTPADRLFFVEKIYGLIQTSNFNDTSVSIEDSKLNNEDLLFIVNIVNNEGDQAFQSDADSFTPDYNIDLTFFPCEQQKLYEWMNENSGLTMIEKIYGAARNG